MSSVAQKCWSEVLLRTVDEKFRSEVLLKLSTRSVHQKRGSKVLLRSGRSEALLRSVDQKKCGSEVLIRCR